MSVAQTKIGTFLARQGELWNSGDRERFVAVYREIAPAGFGMEFPVGTPVQRGWDALDALWDNYQAAIKVSYPIVAVADNGEAAVLERIEAQVGGQAVTRHSIHSYVFADDAMLVRYFAESPQPSDAAQATRSFLLRQSALWNAGDKEAFYAAYAAFTSHGFDIEFPIGTPPHPGRALLEQLWAGYQADVMLNYRYLYVTDSNEAAICVANERVVDGRVSANNSLEFYSFDAAGVLHVRYFHEGHE